MFLEATQPLKWTVVMCSELAKNKCTGLVKLH